MARRTQAGLRLAGLLLIVLTGLLDPGRALAQTRAGSLDVGPRAILEEHNTALVITLLSGARQESR